MNQAAYEIVDRDGEARLRLTGDWTTTALGRLGAGALCRSSSSIM